MKRSILIAIDESPASRAATKIGLEVAAAMGAEVRFLHASPEIARKLAESRGSDPDTEERVVASDEVLAQAMEAANQAGVTAEFEVVDEAGQDRIADRIVGVAAAIEATLIVVGSRGRGAVAGSVLGSVSQGVLKYAREPVLVAHADREPDDQA